MNSLQSLLVIIATLFLMFAITLKTKEHFILKKQLETKNRQHMIDSIAKQYDDLKYISPVHTIGIGIGSLNKVVTGSGNIIGK